MVTQDVVYQALRRCGSLPPGYTAPPEIMADAMTEWSAFYDRLATRRTASYSIPTYEYPVTGPGSQTNGNGYQIGPTAADWVGPRPESIVHANCVLTNQGSQPVYIPLRPVSAEEWASLAIQQIPGVNITAIFYYDPQFPNGVFNVFPPLSGNSIQLYCWGFLTPPAALATAFSAPPGYWDMVVWNLAARLRPMVRKILVAQPVSQAYLDGKAYESLEAVCAVNRPIPRLRNDMPGGLGPDGYYDSFVTYTGEPY